MTKTATLSDEKLRARRDQILVKLDTTLEELCDRARNYALIGEEHQAWEELESIAFLLGENRA